MWSTLAATLAFLRFGPFALDPASLQLTKEGRRVRLPPQPAKVLAVLASRAGEVYLRSISPISRRFSCDSTAGS